MGFYKGNKITVPPLNKKTKLQTLNEERDGVYYAINKLHSEMTQETGTNDLGRLNRATEKNGMAAKYRELTEAIAEEKARMEKEKVNKVNSMRAYRVKEKADQEIIDQAASLEARAKEDAIIDRLIERGPSDTK